MPLKNTKLLNEYFLANNTAKFISGGSKCSWDEKNSKLTLHKAPYIFCMFLGITFGVVGAYHAAQLSLGKTFRSKFIGVGVVFTSGPFIVYFYALNYLWHRQQMELLLNNLLQIEPKCKDFTLWTSGHIQMDKVSCWILRTMGIWEISVSIALGAMLLPELPFNIFANGLGSWMFQKLHILLLPWQHGRWYLERCIIFSASLIMWTNHVKISLVGAIEVIIISSCLVVLIRQFKSDLSRYGYFRKETLEFYRQIQLLVDLFNHIMSTQLVVKLAAFGCNQIAAALKLIQSAVISAKVIQVTFNDYAIKFAMSAFAFSVLCNLLVIINFLFGCCAQVHDASYKGLSKLRKRQQFKTSKRYGKILQSLPILSIRFGIMNYVEKQTPIVFQMFLVQRFVDYLLLK